MLPTSARLLRLLSLLSFETAAAVLGAALLGLFASRRRWERG